MKKIGFGLIVFLLVTGLTVPAGISRPKVLIKTSLGDITIELYPDKAPATVQNFLRYVDEKFYDNTLFHRIIKDFMVQGGGFTTETELKDIHPHIKNEADRALKNKRGTIAFGREEAAHTIGAQFFINTVDNDGLDFTSRTDAGWGYPAFGTVIEGMDVVDAIEDVKTMTYQDFKDFPRKRIIIFSIRRIDEQ
ncbi:MAG: peptidylprolyl isomerase [Acidobacteriota bacterium]|nr:peptidylprolyl isomerase [Acidobacteriota bacterium]MCG2814864.1 peptidylprolyl isomerase [Candidatus Aminicenantes bacterium]